MTIFDIASKAGVSISTVSRVLNNPDLVKPATRSKVEDVLKKYNYTPSAIARGLVHNSMHTIGILSSDIRRLAFSSAAYILESLFFDWGYSTILCNTGHDLSKKKKYIRILSEKKVNGLIMLGSIFCYPEIEEAISTYLPQTPIVLTQGTMSLPNVCSILINHEYGMRQLIGHLAEKGHKRILFVCQDKTYNALSKIEGFKRAMEEHSLPIMDDTFWETGRQDETAATVIEKLLSIRDLDAIVCTEDLLAIGIIKYCKARGINIPGDIAVSGYDNSIFSQLYTPTITSVDVKIDIVSSYAANTLHDIISKKVSQRSISSITVRPELIIGEST